MYELVVDSSCPIGCIKFKQVEVEQEVFKCKNRCNRKYCNKIFTRKQDLVRHIKKEIFTCRKCLIICSRKDALLRHLRKICK